MKKLILLCSFGLLGSLKYDGHPPYFLNFKNVANLLFVLSLSTTLYASSGSNSGNPFWGQSCETIVTGGGSSCVVIKTVCTQYILWIPVGTNVENVTIDCSNVGGGSQNPNTGLD